MKGRSLDLYVEELVLHGFPAGDRYVIAEAVERELARLFTEQGASSFLAQGGTIDRLNGGSFAVAPVAKPEALGAQIAQAVYGGLNP
jgi:hypothetical protein